MAQASSGTPASFTCPGATQTQLQLLRNLWSESQERAEYRRADLFIDRAETLLKRSCKEGSPQRSQGLEELDRLRRQGWEKELAYLTREIPRRSAFRSIDRERTEFRELAERLGKDPLSLVSGERMLAARLKGQARTKARAQSCQPVDRRTEILGQPLTQGEISWCYAFAAADLLSHRTGRKVSALSIANSYNQSFTLANAWGRLRGQPESARINGEVAAAARLALGQGLCLESELASSPENQDLISSLHAVERLKRDLDAQAFSAHGPFTASWSESLCRRHSTRIEEEIRPLFRSLNSRQITEILLKASADEPIHQLVEGACRNRFRPKPTPELERLKGKSDRPTWLSEALDQSLDRGDIAAIEYSLNTLKSRGKPGPIPHASTIVARRFNKTTGECQYLVRNTQGTYCAFDPELECKDGQTWVPEELLHEATTSVTVFRSAGGAPPARAGSNPEGP